MVGSSLYRKEDIMQSILSSIVTGIVTGVATAGVLGGIGYIWRKYREWRVQQLVDVMGTMIEHRNAGRHATADPGAWVRKAKELEAESEQRASKVSVASGALINWLGELETMDVDDDVRDPEQRHYVKLLTTVISRIRDTLGRHDR
jgi:hypothetical protein